MAVRSAFATNRPVSVPAGNSTPSAVKIDLRGIDLTSPYDAIQKNRSPFARNFRMYAQENGDRRVAISNRKGSGRYLDPIGEVANVSDQSTTNSTDALIGVSTNWLAMKFVPNSSGQLTHIDLRLKQNGASGPLIVELWTDNAGVPGTKLADTGILNSDINTTPAYVSARFIESPTVTSASTYWIVTHMQDDGTGNYSWRTNSDSALALVSNNGGLSWTAAGYSLAYKTFITPAVSINGITRYAPETSTNSTLFVVGTTMYKGNDNTGASTSLATGLSASATDYFFAEMDGKKFWANGYDDLKYYDNTTVSTITHVNLPKLRLMVAHKNRIFGVSATDPNRLVFSEDPGNDDGAGHTWYSAWLSTSFIYVPTPKAQDPITALVVFQDNLYIFTRTSKYVLYGSDPGSFSVRQSTGRKGALHQNGVYADENYIYFVSTDGLYRHNGSSDEKISDNGQYGVQPEFSAMAEPDKCFVTKWKGMVRFYYPSANSAYNNRCLLWHTVFQEWFLDTDAFVARAVVYNDGDDPDYMIEACSTAPRVMYAEMDYNNLGKAIDFQYHCKYDSFGNPAQLKRIQKLFPMIEGANGNYTIQVGIDKDREDTPVWTDYAIETSGAKIGQFAIGDGTKLGIPSQFKPKRISVSGYAYYWQLRVKRKAINNKVAFIGYVLATRGKRL